MGPRLPESLESFMERLQDAVAAGKTEVRFGQYHHSHAVCVEEGLYRVRRLEYTAEQAEAHMKAHGMFMPENAEEISAPKTLVFEAGSIDELEKQLASRWPL